MPADPAIPIQVAVIGGGPAGLMAAETLAGRGLAVDLFDAKPSVGRKFLIAGRGGLNLTHSEPFDRFVTRYGERAADLRPFLEGFSPDALRAWARGLGVETFVGTSGRVFPVDFKAGPLLRRWVHRLHDRGVRIHVRHRWSGFAPDGTVCFVTPQGLRQLRANACILALGGGSWAHLGSDGAWVARLEALGIPVVPLRPANCGFDATWSDHFATRFAGQPVKSVVASTVTARGEVVSQPGDLMITATGIEGGPVYALAAPLRDALGRGGAAELTIDLAPGRPLERLVAALARPRGRRSLGAHLKREAGIEGVKAALLHEVLDREAFVDATGLARAIRGLRVRLSAPRPLDEAISTAGGVPFPELDSHLMLRRLPGVFCAGEMIDWEAPTGGYLLSACFASGVAAARGAAAWIHREDVASAR
ncbi:MAG: TIGR03862 family flavoprotein [Betaproteobacteria bacterium]